MCVCVCVCVCVHVYMYVVHCFFALTALVFHELLFACKSQGTLKTRTCLVQPHKSVVFRFAVNDVIT